MINYASGKHVLIDGTHLHNNLDVLEINKKYNKNYSNSDIENGSKGTMAYEILTSHNTSGDDKNLQMKFDAMTSHDITFVGIVQTAIASGLKKFPIPYVLTNCHNSLCAVGGTINEDDHLFGLSAAKKFGGIYVPANQAVIHQYMREMFAGGGKMILGSDSHTRYGAFGTIAIGEGGGELVKQLLEKTYDIAYPEVVAIYLEGTPKNYVGPQDVALTLIKEAFKDGRVKNKILEFVGPGIENLGMDFRNGIDVMTTETTCLSSIWKTDDTVKDFLAMHGRESDYKKLDPSEVAVYDSVIKINLSEIKPMIALPFHPSNVYTLDEFNANPVEILKTVEEDAKVKFENANLDFTLTDKVVDGKVMISQGIIGGCSGGIYENLVETTKILAGNYIGSDAFDLSLYPSSQAEYYELAQAGYLGTLMETGAVLKPAFCGPCFGAGDTPAHNTLSIRHNTRNFPNREGSKPANGQISYVALMDAKSIAATAINGGVLTSAEHIEMKDTIPKHVRKFNENIYKNRVYNGFDNPDENAELIEGPNIKKWPEMKPLNNNLLLKFASVIKDPVTTTDELIPSGETSSFRSDPHKLSDFTLSRKDPNYVNKSKAIRNNSETFSNLEDVFASLKINDTKDLSYGSTIFAIKPGDGSAREQAASCQKVLGAWANIVEEFATKRYRSNCINWGMIPFSIKEKYDFKVDDYVYVTGIKDALLNGDTKIKAIHLSNGVVKEITLHLENLSKTERDVLVDGCLINYYRNGN